MKACKTRLLEFLFPAENDHWLTTLRVGLGIELILYSFSLRNDWTFLFSGTVRRLAEAVLSSQSHLIPRFGWFVSLAAQVGVDENRLLLAAWACLFLAGCGLVTGFASRASAITAWLLHLCAAKSGGFVSYGMDSFVTIALFYLMLSPLPDRFSIDWRFRDVRPHDPQMLGFWRRVLQLHLCLIYFFSGLAKCLGPGWWDGSSVWRALIRPPFNLIDPGILVTVKYVFPLAGILVCLLEFGYPFFIWNTKTRKIWFLGICMMHVGIAVTMGMYLFSLVMIVLNVAAFGAGMFRLEREQIRLEPNPAGA
jgi:vitamin K-dependent gamma-carboxylase-like protein